jgi:RimJ/RimL family protein N-acetyltransferase
MEDFATARLIAEKLDQTHLNDLTQLHLDPEVSLYLGGIRSPELTKTYLDVNLAHWAEHGFGLWVIRTLDGAFVGRAGLRNVELEGAREIEIAYSLVRAYWGHGLATEITGALTKLWLSQLRSPSLVGLAAVGNTASCRVLEKSGFIFERKAIYHGAKVVVFRRVRPVIGKSADLTLPDGARRDIFRCSS